MAPSQKSQQPPSSFRLRPLLEPVILGLVIYIVLGAPGLSSLPFTSPSSSSSGSSFTDTTKPHVNPGVERLESIVYPPLPGEQDLNCGEDTYRTHVISREPLVLYIEGFLSAKEVEELKGVSEPIYQPSTLFSSSSETVDPSIRRSEKALLPRSQTVRCIESRARALQGWPAYTFIERLWTQRYNVSGHYALHYDWSSENARARRMSSFMVYLSTSSAAESGKEKTRTKAREEEELEGGGTHFPRLVHPGVQNAEWCRFIECTPPSSASSSSSGRPAAALSPDPATGLGVTFRPIAGNAVFWLNFDAQGRGYRETLHAGLPVTKGQKVGLNVWSWYQEGHVRPQDWLDE